MWQFIVLGRIPGTDLQFGFYHLVNTISLAAVAYLVFHFIKDSAEIQAKLYELTKYNLL